MHPRLKLWFVVGAALMLVLAACGRDPGVLPGVSSVTITQGDVSVDVGDAVALSVEVDATGGADESVTWSVDDSAIATVDEDGVVTGVAVGTTIVTATSVFDDAVSDSVTVTVTEGAPTPAVTSVVIEEGDQTIVEGDTFAFTATVAATGGADESVTWSVDEPAIATVDEDGVVTAVAEGVAVLSATSVFDDTVGDAVTITVVAPVGPPPPTPAVTAVVIGEGDQALAVGGDVQLTVTVTATGGASQDVSWSSSDDDVATVVDGLVTGVAAGVATITATSVFDGAVSDSVTVTVDELTAGAETGGTYVSLDDVSVGLADAITGERPLGFDVAWTDSWRETGPSWVEATDNWDAVWVFAKYRVAGGDWQHASIASGTHASATVSVPADGRGAFVYRSSAGSGAFAASGVSLVWDAGADGVESGVELEVRLFAIEMVFVPQGAFSLGTGGTESNGFRAGGSDDPFVVSEQGPISLGGGVGQLDWAIGNQSGTPAGTTAAAFPTGYEAFYAMKHQVTQGQYVAFLNTLTQAQASARTHVGSANRYAITGAVVGEYETTLPLVAMNFVSWADGAAYSAWAGLRPMSELEYEKAARGTAAPVADEFAWGTATVTPATDLIDAGTSDEAPSPANANANVDDELDGPTRVGMFASAGDTREQAGASFYGVLELSGTVWERVLTVGNATGQGFTGLHGDGSLTAGGDAAVTGWPAADAEGAGFRGGSWDAPDGMARVSDREFAAATNPDRTLFGGWRAVRSAP